MKLRPGLSDPFHEMTNHWGVVMNKINNIKNVNKEIVYEVDTTPEVVVV